MNRVRGHILLRASAAALSLAIACMAAAGAEDPAALLKKGIALGNAGRFLEAEAVLESIPEGTRQFAEAQSLLGYSYLRRALPDQAAQALGRALREDPDRASARLGLAVALAQKGKLEQALGQLERILRDPSVGERAAGQRIQILIWLGREEEAFRDARRLASLHPRNAEIHALLGFLSTLSRNTEEAMREYRRALELSPRSLSYFFSLIALHRAQKDWAGAYRLAQAALEVDRDQPLIYAQLAAVCDEMGRKEEAEEARRMQERTFEAETLYTRAVLSRSRGRLKEAEGLLQDAVRTHPGLAKAWSELGELQRRDGRLEAALESFGHALEAAPANPVAGQGLAAAVQERSDRLGAAAIGEAVPSSAAGRSREAEDAIRRALEELPGNADLLSFLGYLRESAGREAESMRSYSEALAADPLHVGALLGSGRHLLRTGDGRRAAAAFREAAGLEPSNAHAWIGLILALRQAGDRIAAERACRACIERSRIPDGCREALARLQLEAAEYGAAAAQLEDLSRRGRESKEVVEGLAYARMKTGRTDDAIELFERSLRRFGADPWIYQNLGHLYRTAGRFDRSADHYGRARRLSPDNAEICHNLGFSLFLDKKYALAVEPLREALRLRPGWGLAHFNLSMTYWNLRLHADALVHARAAEEKGVPEARKIVQMLSANLSQGTPRSISVFRPRS